MLRKAFEERYTDCAVMGNEEEEIKNRAVEFARANRLVIAKRLTDPSVFPPDQFPVSVFMAGSPGAGKTESSRNLIKKFASDHHATLCIDSDELRSEFNEYNGKNSSLFIGATSIIADKMQDLALDRGQSFVFDGTLSNIEVSRKNIERSLKPKRKRFVQIVYVYQDPLQAWSFVKAREARDGRSIPRESFISQYFIVRQNVNILKAEFGSRIKVDLIVKNVDGTDFGYRENIDSIDGYMPEKYTKEDLERDIIL